MSEESLHSYVILRSGATRTLLRSSSAPASIGTGCATGNLLPARRGALDSQPAAVCRDLPTPVVHFALNLPPLFPEPPAILPEPGECRQRRSLDRETGSEHDRVAGHRGNKGRQTFPEGLIVDPQKKTILDRMHVDLRRHGGSPFRQIAPAVIGNGVRRVETLPAEILKPPGEVRVFAIEKEVGIEITG